LKAVISLKSVQTLKAKPLFYVLCILLFLSFPWIVNGYYVHMLILLGIYLMLTTSLDLSLGTTGILQLGHAGFFGLGAYTGALISTKLLPDAWFAFWLGLPFVLLITLLAGLLIGIPTLRLKGHYFGLATLAFGEIIYGVLLNWEPVTEGSFGVKAIPSPHIGNFDLGPGQFSFYLIWVFTLVTIWILYALRKSRFGRFWRAIREDEIAASTMGINTFKQKLYSLAISAGIAGIAGTLFAHYVSFISPTNFTLDESILLISMVIVGGKDKLRGVFLGTALLVILPEILRPIAEYRLLIYGFILAIMIIYRPEGIVGKREK
jgi:branched-chain amino acid transport system permease protein